VKCNNPLVADVWASVTRIVTDKTGTLTENKMIPKDQLLYIQENEDTWVLKEATLMHEIDHDMENHLMAIMSTTGMEPEEISIASCVKHIAKIK
jgi:P-type E1-E2 ATPase